MTNKEKDMILKNLVNVESGIAKIYNRFSIKNGFSAPVQKFWREIAVEERLHADIFDELRQAMNDKGIPVAINLDVDYLKKFVNKINELVKKTSKENFTDSDAYSMGALIEMELDEAGFVDKIQTTDPKYLKMLKRVENDTKKHRVMMVNYSRGVK